MLGLAALLALATVSQLRADLFVAENINDTIQRYDGVSGVSDGTFANTVNAPTGVTFGPDGNLYVVSSDGGFGQVYRYNGTTGAPMPSPMNMSPDPAFSTGLGMSGAQFLTFGPDVTGDLYPDLYATWQNNVNVYNGSTGALLSTFTLLSNNPQNSNPSFTGITVGNNGMLYISDINGSPFDNFGNGVVSLNPNTGIFSTFVASGTGGLNSPTGLTFGIDGNLYVAGSVNGPGIGAQVLRYAPNGAFLGAFVPSGNNGGIQLPQGMVFGPDGNLYLVSGFHNPATMFTPGTNTFVERYDGLTGMPEGMFAMGTDMEAFFGLAFSNLAAVPEPSTWVAGIATFAALLAHARRRFRRV